MELTELKDKQFIFIIGAPRSGTTWLYKALSLHPGVATIGHELTLFNNYISPLVRSYENEMEPLKKGKWKIGLPLLWSREKLDRFILDFIDKSYTSMDIQPEQKIVLDKHPGYSHHVELIRYYLPKAKFIHIIRDGRDAAYSWKQTWYSTGFGNPYFRGACLDWIDYKNKAKKAKKYGDDYYELRYEDLVSNFSNQLTHIFTFCKLSPPPELIQSIVKQATGEENMVSIPDNSVSYTDRISGKALWKTRLSKEELYLAKKYLKKELIKEGYEKDTNWGLGAIDNFLIFGKQLAQKAYKKIMNNLPPWKD